MAFRNPFLEITNNAYNIAKEDIKNCNPKKALLEVAGYLFIIGGVLTLFNFATHYTTSQNLQGIQERLGTQAALIAAEHEAERIQRSFLPLTLGIESSITDFVQENQP